MHRCFGNSHEAGPLMIHGHKCIDIDIYIIHMHRCFGDSHEAGPVIWRLNGRGVFPRFRHVILIGSQQDKFIPLYSSHMQPPTNLPASDPRRRAVARMVEHSLSSLSYATLIRVTVYFRGAHSAKLLSVDEAFGRAGHVAFLEHIPFMRLLSVR